jgi:hypothetical protein
MPVSLTIGTVSPMDFTNLDFRKNNLDSPRSVNLGVVVGKLINTCQFVGHWIFSLDEYKLVNDEYLGGEYLGMEEELLDELVRLGLLSREGEYYYILDKFLEFFPPK